MSQPAQSSAGVVVVDANIFISICSKEPTEATARTALADYAMRSWDFYAPNVIFAEVLFALCRKMTEGTLDAASHKRAVDDFQLSFLPKLLPPPMGDALYTPAPKKFGADIAAFIPLIVFTLLLRKSSQRAVRLNF